MFDICCIQVRRRRVNTLTIHARRSQRYTWLETHIWHAKRMHMFNRWGYRIAEAPTDKSQRACYKAMKHMATVQDISFIACIQIDGERQLITEMLKQLIPPSQQHLLDANMSVSVALHLHVHMCEVMPMPMFMLILMLILILMFMLMLVHVDGDIAC
jgi:hypothetical protein